MDQNNQTNTPPWESVQATPQETVPVSTIPDYKKLKITFFIVGLVAFILLIVLIWNFWFRVPVTKNNSSGVISQPTTSAQPTTPIQVAPEPKSNSFSLSILNPKVTTKSNKHIEFNGVLRNDTNKDIYIVGPSLSLNGCEATFEISKSLPVKMKPGEEYKGLLFDAYIPGYINKAICYGNITFQGGFYEDSLQSIADQGFTINVIE